MDTRTIKDMDDRALPDLLAYSRAFPQGVSQYVESREASGQDEKDEARYQHLVGSPELKDCWITNQERARWIKEQSNLEHENTEPLGSAATTGWPYTVADKDQPYKPPDLVNSPPHYRIGKYEVIDVIEEWFPDDPHLFSAVQYLARAAHKGNFRQDCEKAIWYITRRLKK